MTYAPIVLFTYKRLDSLKHLLDSLEMNPEAINSDLYIYSDLNEKENDSDKVAKVRCFLTDYRRNNTDFKSITVYEADKHKGLANSVISGVTEILERYGRVIVLEDDLVLSEYFLNYMNQCLDYYEKDDRIWSINGYSSHVKAPAEYVYPVFLDYRASSWGWATWKDRWERVDWSMPDYSSFRWNLRQRARFCRGGNDLPSMLKAYMRGKIDSWAIRWCYYQSRFDKYSITPVNTLVINEGFGDGATNCNDDSEELLGGGNLCQELLNWRCDDLVPARVMTDQVFNLYSLTLNIRIRDKIREIDAVIKGLIRRISMGEYSVIYRRIDRTAWNVCSGFGSSEQYDQLRPSLRYWYADPMPYTIADQTFVFMEMMDHRTLKGVIGVSAYDSQGKLSKPRVIIDEPFHMSFPHVFDFNGNTYMIPETSEVEQLRVYKMGEDVYQWEIFRIFENLGKLVDTITMEKDGHLYFLACELHSNPLKTRLILFKLDDINKGMLAEIPMENEEYSYECRNAGPFIYSSGHIYRISQGSMPDEYGVYMTLNEVDSIGSEGLREHVIKRIGVDDIGFRTIPIIQKKKGIHTYGISGRYEVMDVLIGKISIKRILRPFMK